MSSNYNVTRSQIIQLENTTKKKLATYSSKYAQYVTKKPNFKEIELDKSIETLIKERGELLESITNSIDEDNDELRSKYLKHKSELNKDQKELNNLRSCINQERNHLNLLITVKKDILAENNNFSSTEEYMNDESMRIDKQTSVMDKLIQDALNSRNQIMEQSNEILFNSNSRVNRLLQRVPGISTLLTKINTRRKKNMVIMSCLIGVCMFLIFLTF
ncbi:related to Golgi SNAP receptor complex member 1 [Hanseniaspora guilliermondii]|uniref:Related to Golgi SNAP receptor complex member 1 n=1 Tax=Hanseniaspora guilliermondii TaxID=56406 RepID=A0A1L0AZ68_9ASCO|nr:related to Golgi SNAP receptor complex member 1 [Hanseniaspora guilliermondii]